jgi:hypothetical protein
MTSRDSSNSPIGCKYAFISVSPLNAGGTGGTGGTRGHWRWNRGRLRCGPVALEVEPWALEAPGQRTWSNGWLCHGQQRLIGLGAKYVVDDAFDGQTEPGWFHQFHPPCGPGSTCKCLNSHYVPSVPPGST